MSSLLATPTRSTEITTTVKPLSVLSIHNRYLERGGEDGVFEQEARLLQEYGCKVVAASHEMTNPSGVLAKIRIARDAAWSDTWYEKVRGLIEDNHPDVVHVHNFFPIVSPSVYYACHDAGVAVVQTLHNFRLLCPGATFYRDGHVCEECPQHGLHRAVLHGCYRDSHLGTAALVRMLRNHRRRDTWASGVDRYIALSEFARNKFIAGGLPAEKISVKPNFVLPDPGFAASKGYYALFVGRLADYKGLETLIQAWRGLKFAVPLVIAGDGPLRPELEAALQDKRLQAVSYCGRLSRPDTLAAMQGARVLISPSECYENFPVTIAEAYACGTPVIASRLGSMVELIAEGRTGLQFEAGSPEDLARKVEWAWSHPGEMGAMSRAARAEFESRYTAEQNYRMLIEIYQQAIAARA
jgi:glycosyltransferase involved in cell wall biosynthesis